MDGRYPAYPAYKPSGVEWLGEIPAHWEVRRLKFVASINPSKSEVSHLPDDTEVSFLPMERVGNGTLDLELTKPLKEIKQGFTYFRDGDVIVAKITPSFENGKGALAFGLASGIGFGTTELHVIRATPLIDRQFVYYLTLSHQFRGMGETQMYGTAGQKRVPDRFINNFPTPLPPLPEQRAIAAYLDRETARIDALIAHKRDLLALLERQRAALISHAVTRGLNPDVPLKPSGVEWLGEIPEHWEINKVKTLARPGYKTFIDGDWIESPYITTDGIRLIQTGNIGIGVYREQGFRYISEKTFRDFNCTEIEPGDVLICRLGDPVGRACLAPNLGKRMITSVDVCILKTRDDINPSYIVYTMSSSQYLDWVNSLVRGSTRDRISRSMLGNFFVPIPPFEEQRAIAAYLDRETARIDRLKAEIEASIDLLGRYRAALISAAVTGKIKVVEN